MKFQKKREIKQQIRELRTIISLQEQGKKLFVQAIEEKISQNKELINFLRGNVRSNIGMLGIAQKHDQMMILEACQEQKQMKMCLARSTVEAAREKLRNYIFDKTNVHNLLLYEVKRRGQALEGLQRRLQFLKDMEAADKKCQKQMQIIRQLENNIEKMMMKISTGEKIYYLYLKMMDFLKDELAYLPLELNALQHMVEVYHVELRGMKLMALDNTEATEAATADMTNMEMQLIAEKKYRENSLNFKKKQIDKIRVKDTTAERHRRVTRRDINMDFPTLLPRESLKGVKLEPSKAQMEYQSRVTSDVEKVKCAVECSHLWDISGRFLAQQKSTENLQQQIKECDQKRKELEAKLRELELERAELKFHQTPTLVSSKKLEEELKKNLEQEETRLEQTQAQMLKNQKLLLCFENGVDNLFVRLYGVTVPNEGDIHVDTTDTYEKLKFCETKLLHLTKVTSNLPSYNFSREENNESFVKVRNFLEETTKAEPQNLKISFEDEEDAVRDAFDFADKDQSFVPNREEIKKQGLNLIESKTRTSKKKQRGARKNP
ncbi:PREDICTED: coiled-coil domain-containing protein 183 [Gavialis gangeticus]|uniref:coiled-coil domain-containing protein 183 n=1 Tax=Gavialis gangeticus TaxID=94835 RepID=UPI00092F6441|nr:PREDICTED: coiled-coil domain-containing protein 183 [Gavialis gangeticus]